MFFTARLGLGDFYSVEDIDSGQPIELTVAGSLPIPDLSRAVVGNELRVDFARQEVQDVAPIGEDIEFRVTGLMIFGCDFEGIDHILVIGEGLHHTTMESEIDPSTILDDAIRGSVGQLEDNSGGELGETNCLENYESNYTFGLNTDLEEPLPGEAFFYLYKFCNGTTTCTYGQNSMGETRISSVINGPPGACP
jgi:hypothetical protein